MTREDYLIRTAYLIGMRYPTTFKHLCALAKDPLASRYAENDLYEQFRGALRTFRNVYRRTVHES